MPKHIKNVKQPQVGKMYLVPCAELSPAWVRDAKKTYLPIIGPPHADPELSVPVEHYHFDGRFLSPADEWITRANNKGQTNRLLANDVQVIFQDKTFDFNGKIALRVKKCRRLSTGPLESFFGTWLYSKWYHSYLGKECQGKKCPHLGAVMHQVNDNRLVCPLHGLQASKKSGKIILPTHPLKHQSHAH